MPTAAQETLAQQSLDVLQVLGPAFGVRHLMLDHAGARAVASAHGGLVALRDGPINLGLLFRSLQDEPVVPVGTRTDDPLFENRADAAMWQVLRRILQTVAPRQLIFAAGEVRLEVAAADGAFDLVQAGASLVDSFADLRAQVSGGADLSYTLGDPPQGIAGSYGPADLVRAAAGHDVATDAPGQWQACAGSWPGQVPPDVTQDALTAVLLAAQVVKDTGGPMTLTGYTADRQPILQGTLADTGMLRLQVAPV